MTRKALVVQGGWDGHTPKESADLWFDFLQEQGFEVRLSDTLEVYTEQAYMQSLNLIVPIWTMGQITKEQEQGLLQAVRSGAGLAGFHGGMCDSFRNNVEYQWMTGGQWVAHPGNLIERYRVKIEDHNHPVTMGISDFDLVQTEQYWLHVCPSNHVLASTYFKDYDMTMPYAWTRQWGKGRVFYVAWGHTYKDFDIPQARIIVERGMLWAAGDEHA